MSNFSITASQDGTRHFRDNGGYHHSRGSRKGNRGYRGHRNNQYGDRRGGPKRLDEDVQMDNVGSDSHASTSHQRFDPYDRRQRRDHHPRGRLAMDRPSNGVMSRLGLPFGNDSNRAGGDWYRVNIPHGKKLDKDFIIKSISSAANLPFIPVYFHIEDQEAVFYVYGSAEARAIQSTSRRITAPAGFKVVVVTKKSGPPATPLTETAVAKLKECMSKRYDVAGLSLNLSDLCNDDDLKQEEIYLSLRRGPVVTKVLEIIDDNIRDLRVLDLSKNSLQEPEHFLRIEEKAPHIQQLNLAQNQIRYERELHVFSKLNIVELCLDGNPLCDKFSDRQVYISTIRKRFPKVLKLDGNDLPPPITFDIEASTSMPEKKGNFFLNDKKIEDIICNFVNQYFPLYDSNNRQPLIDAYHEQAVFSLSCYNLTPLSHNSAKQPSLSDYNGKCRNLVRTKDNFQRHNRLKMGRVAIVAALSELPNTQHDLQSFIVDVGFALGSMLTFTVTGVFREVSNKTDKDVLRHFTRTFVVMVNGDRLAVTNEMLCVTNVQPGAAKKYFQSPSVVPVVTTLPTPEVKQSMITSFSAQSGMNDSFSAMCLEQNNWDYNRAAAVFLDMKQKNTIPPEAFVK